MRAINLKQRYLETASWAYLVSRVVPGIRVFGGIALKRSVGGLNVNAVEQAATFKGGFVSTGHSGPAESLMLVRPPKTPASSACSCSTRR